MNDFSSTGCWYWYSITVFQQWRSAAGALCFKDEYEIMQLFKIYINMTEGLQRQTSFLDVLMTKDTGYSVVDIQQWRSAAGAFCFEDKYEITWPVEICRNAAIQIPFEQISQNAAGPDEEKHIKY